METLLLIAFFAALIGLVLSVVILYKELVPRKKRAIEF